MNLRRLLVPLLSATIAACSSDPAPDRPGEVQKPEMPTRQIDETAIQAIENRVGGRVGVALVDADGTLLSSYRGDERFAMCSTFKLAMAGTVLEAADAGTLSLDDALAYDEDDLLEYAPVTRENIAAGELSVRELSEAIVTLSDNTAANLLLARIGGPEEVTAFFRRHGDEVTRLDRTEPTLNENAVGDERDTTSPIAMAGLIQRLILGDELSPEAREQLAEWAVANQTGDNRIRAGIPAGWRVGDKTGGCGNASNDIGIVWPPEGEPFVLTVYIDRPTASASEVDAAIAEVGRLAAGAE